MSCLHVVSAEIGNIDDEIAKIDEMLEDDDDVSFVCELSARLKVEEGKISRAVL